jgi:hypothetical protein
MVTAVLSGPLKHVTRQGAAMLAGAAVWGAAFAVFAVGARSRPSAATGWMRATPGSRPARPRRR